MIPGPRPSTRSALRRGLAASLVSLVLVSLSGCGGSSEDAIDPAADPVAEGSASVTDAEEVGDADERVVGASVDREEFLDLFQTSIGQATTAHVAITTSADSGGAVGEGDIDLSTTPPLMQLTMSLDGQGGDVEMRLVDGVAYMLLPQLDGKYVRFDLADPANPLGSAFGDQFDIEKQLEVFGEAILEVTYLGEEDIDGETVESYSLTADGQVIADQAGEAGLGAGAPSLPDEITYEISFDADGLFREMTFDLGGISSTVTYSDWGKEVSIEAPKPSEVTSLPGSAGTS